MSNHVLHPASVRRWRYWEHLIALAIFLLFAGSVFNTHQHQTEYLRPIECPVQLTELVPDRPDYWPFDTMRFHYRETSDDRYFFLMDDSFENVRTGEHWPAVNSRTADRSDGRENAPKVLMRQLPADITPGVYVLHGFVRVYAGSVVLPRGYQSRPFRVQ